MIELQNVSVSYGDAIALYPTTLKLHQGQFTVLLGSSGAGKSTLLRCINSLHASQRGTTNRPWAQASQNSAVSCVRRGGRVGRYG